jgi:fibronectin type 3 domain-containing protein
VTQFVDSGTAHQGLNPGGKYLIRVTAVDSAFNESTPVEASITVPDDRPPGPPSGFVIRNVEGRYVELTWSPSGSLDVRAYAVTRSGGPADTGALAAHRFPASARTWRDTAVTHGRHYTYRLTAVDSAGNVSGARTDSVAFRDLVAPPPPRATSARALTPGAGVEVRWERVVSLELVGYNVYRSSLPTGVYRRLTRAPVSLLTFTDSTGHAGFYYRVRAVDKSGNESTPSPAAPVVGR